MRRTLLLCALVLLSAGRVFAVPPPVTGTTYHVPADGSLQAVLNGLSGPAEIRITAGTYTTNITLPNVAVPDGQWIIIRSDDANADLVPSTYPWVTPSMTAHFAKFQPSDGQAYTLTAASGAHNYYFFGLEFKPNTVRSDLDLVSLGAGATTLSQSPSHITFESCYFHGDATLGQHRGLRFDVQYGVVRTSYFEKFIETGRDSQAIIIINGTGPFTIENNYLEASGENFLTGGGDPSISGAIPSDGVFRGNYCFKPTAWKVGFPDSVKNLFELKLAKRWLVENNVFENTWLDRQVGDAVLFTVRDQDGGASWSTVQDVTFQFNVIKQCDRSGINMLGIDDTPGKPSVQGTNMVITHNLILSCDDGFFVNSGYQPTTITHNTIPTLGGKGLQFLGNHLPSGEFTFQNNVVGSSTYGIAGEGTGLGVNTLDTYAPGYTMTKNVIENGDGTNPVSWPSGNTILTHGTLAAFLDSDHAYSGIEATSDGGTMGADLTELKLRIPWFPWNAAGTPGTPGTTRRALGPSGLRVIQ